MDLSITLLSAAMEYTVLMYCIMHMLLYSTQCYADSAYFGMFRIFISDNFFLRHSKIFC